MKIASLDILVGILAVAITIFTALVGFPDKLSDLVKKYPWVRFLIVLALAVSVMSADKGLKTGMVSGFIVAGVFEVILLGLGGQGVNRRGEC